MKKHIRASLYRKVKSLSKRLGYNDEDYYKKLYKRSKSQAWIDELDKLNQRLVTRELTKEEEERYLSCLTICNLVITRSEKQK